MQRMFVIALLSFITASLAFGASSEKKKKSASSAMGGDEQVVTKLEEEWAAALVKNDLSVVDRVAAPEWMLTLPDGQMMSKSQSDADMKSGVLKFESFHLDEMKVKVYGDTAIVFGLETEKSTYKGEDMSGQYRFTDVFIKRDGKWQCVATHTSKVMKQPEKP
jgi:ketosteroid isomerase-like protein